MDVSKEIKEIIEKNLPQAAAGAMKDFHLKDKVKEQALTITGLEADIEKNGSLNDREHGLNTRERAIEDRERAIDLEVANIKLSCAEHSTLTVERLVEKVFGHPSVTVSTVRQSPIMAQENYTPYEAGQSVSSESVETTQGKA
jgi:hypothetical protein